MRNMDFKTGVALSPRQTLFGPVLFMGRLEQGLYTLNQAGFKFVELSLRTIGDVNLIELNRDLDRFNLSVSAIATGQACLFDSLCLCTPDDEVRNNAINHIKQMIEFAGEIGTERVIIGGVRGRLAGSEDQRIVQYGYGVDAIRKCAEWAQMHGITLLIEPINRYEANWILTAQEGLDIINEIGVPALKLLLDTFHMNIEESSIKTALIKAGDNLGYVHFADNTRCAPGQGQTNFSEILKTLKEINFQGPVISEILPLPDDVTAVQQTADFWSSIIIENAI